MKIEVIATTLQEALDIEKAGADRIELISGILEGGLTPSIGLISEVCNSVNIPVNVMVRPHAKSFNYDEKDIKVILQDIHNIKKTKANGIVFGALTKERKIDLNLLQKVIDSKGDLRLTFHRAIDDSDHIIEEFQKLLHYDIDHVLTSAGENHVTKNIPRLNHMIELSKSYKTTVLAGSGLYPDTIIDFVNQANVTEIHLGRGARKNTNSLEDIDIDFLKNLIRKIKQ